MATDLIVPSAGESITEVAISTWLKAEGDWVNEDDPVVEIETDKANLELGAPVAGLVGKHLKNAGQTANVGEIIGSILPGEKPAEATPTSNETAESTPAGHVMPAAARALAQAGLEASDVKATGPGGRLLKEDVPKQAATPEQTAAPGPAPVSPPPPKPIAGSRNKRVEAMTSLRRRISQNLVQAQQNAALLTTFNEVDMSAVMALRKTHQEAFVEKHGVKLGFMSLFVKACVEALQAIPAINARIDGDDVVYYDYCDIGVAVGGGKGLVVPVLRNAEAMSHAAIELQIRDFAARAKARKIKPDELMGGTFTISNGGVYGSMLSTPIVNPPQSGILGMHNILQRPVAVDGQVVIRPMMYIALTYDHRIVDGREAVTFLKTVKQHIETPALVALRTMLEL